MLLISETKIYSSFPAAQFKIEGYNTYRWDRNSNGRGILLYVREDIPSTLLKTELVIEGFCIEINIRKKKWLLVCTYNSNKNLISNHLKEIGNNLDILLNLIILFSLVILILNQLNQQLKISVRFMVVKT